MNINDITRGMTPQEKEVYFKHMEKRHREEQEYIEARKEELKVYKESLIDEILESERGFIKEKLKRKDIKTLERIAYYF